MVDCHFHKSLKLFKALSFKIILTNVSKTKSEIYKVVACPCIERIFIYSTEKNVYINVLPCSQTNLGLHATWTPCKPSTDKDGGLFESILYKSWLRLPGDKCISWDSSVFPSNAQSFLPHIVLLQKHIYYKRFIYFIY